MDQGVFEEVVGYANNTNQDSHTGKGRVRGAVERE